MQNICVKVHSENAKLKLSVYDSVYCEFLFFICGQKLPSIYSFEVSFQLFICPEILSFPDSRAQNFEVRFQRPIRLELPSFERGVHTTQYSFLCF